MPETENNISRAGTDGKPEKTDAEIKNDCAESADSTINDVSEFTENVDLYTGGEKAPSFRLERFDGPLDLLLILIAKHKINIYDIPIAEILEQYLDYLERMKEISCEVTSEFIIMACELLYIKSKLLLPKEETVKDDPRRELVEKLIEYSKIKAAAVYLNSRQQLYYKRYYASPKPFAEVIETCDYSPEVLLNAISGLKSALRARKEIQKKENVEKVFQLKPVSVEEKIIYLLRRFLRAMKYGNSVSFSGIFADAKNKREAVATFLAMLELVSTGRISYVHHDGDYIISLNTGHRDGKNAAPSEENKIVTQGTGA